jgi:hypothetical protein
MRTYNILDLGYEAPATTWNINATMIKIFYYYLIHSIALLYACNYTCTYKKSVVLKTPSQLVLADWNPLAEVASPIRSCSPSAAIHCRLGNGFLLAR